MQWSGVFSIYIW